jgi:hypothetical protein
MIKKVKLRDKESGMIVIVHIKSINRFPKDSVTGTREVIFGRINGKGKEFAFRIPTRFRRVK